MITKSEIFSTVHYYRNNFHLFCALNIEERKALRETLGDMYNAIEDRGIRIEAVLTKAYIQYLTKKAQVKSSKSAYNILVRKISKNQDLSGLENFDKPLVKSVYDTHRDDLYVIDHKVSVSAGFKNNIPPEMIADISNLRIISGKENSDKGVNCFIDEHNEHLRQYIKIGKIITPQSHP